MKTTPLSMWDLTKTKKWIEQKVKYYYKYRGNVSDTNNDNKIT